MREEFMDVFNGETNRLNWPLLLVPRVIEYTYRKILETKEEGDISLYFAYFEKKSSSNNILELSESLRISKMKFL